MTETVKPWGRELLIVANERYALKDIFIKAGTRSSLQYHERKLETILLLSGRLTLESGTGDGPYATRDYTAGESYSISPGMHHRVTAQEDTRLIEVSTPELDDVVRIHDDYGRARS
ncbi:cupin domain-containing protein [Rhodoblastus acidophilus]|uniref:Cupin domain-containing protein n=1 Tax=Rhodoblastus acidophilus TaxID=1074 RepID=A0A6N8DST9_RHOAC|nr:cupin domain-containing protein [Rhodoblastus acidophilus]MCW2275921.1 mannose-6-phosphate isomerase-like protein (cupin superfamily) [Rhodoblastus acidophilus]MTV32595.1 cupin domain-containing protein [Rhodoblastus acidophilus]